MNITALERLFSLDGKVALVTGASGDIGGAIAGGLANAGATVALSGRSATKLAKAVDAITSRGLLAEAFVADLSQREAAAPLAEAVAARMGGIDILVNCAGMNRRMPIDQVTPAVYDEIMETNLHSAYFLTQAVAPLLIARGGGKIIHIGSLTSTIGLANVSVYGMTKSALAQLTRTMAIEWAPHNIQVNCLCPGFIATDLTAAVFNDPQRGGWVMDRLPSGRPGTPDDMVGTALFLAAPASNYMTGQSLYVDGGFLTYGNW